MISIENKIWHILDDIKNCAKESPQTLFARLVNERLDMAIKSYYSDLTYNFSMYGNNEKKLSKDLRRLIK